MHLRILDQESDSDEDPNFMMGYPSPFMSYYYKGDAGMIRLAAARDRRTKQLADEALQQEGGTGVVRREEAPSKGGGVNGSQRSAFWQFVKVLETGKRLTDGKKYKKVQCIIEVKHGKTCDWVRDLVEGETGAIAKHIRTQKDAGHEAAARVCNQSSCNMIECGGGDFVSSLPFEQNFPHHVITPTLCSRLLYLRPSSRCILRIATSSGGMNPVQNSRARGLWAEFHSAFWNSCRRSNRRK